MPAAKQSGRTTRPTSRGRSASNGSRSRAQTRTPKRSSTSSQARRSNGSRSRSESSPAASRQRPNDGTLKSIGVSALSATLGVAGGVLIGRSAVQRTRRVLGVSVPNKIDLGGVGQQIGEAGRQFGKLAGEIRAVREKAEQIGKILT